MQKVPFRYSAIMLLILAPLLQTLVTSASAQEAFTAAAPNTAKSDDHLMGMILTGTGAGALGFAAGAAAGSTMGDGSKEFSGVVEALVVGSIVGGLTLPLGVHHGNKDQGNLGLVMATSLAVGGVGWLIISESNSGAILPAIPLAQLIGCIMVEKATTPSKSGSSQLQRAEGNSRPPILVNLMPTRDGVGLLFSGSF